MLKVTTMQCLDELISEKFNTSYTQRQFMVQGKSILTKLIENYGLEDLGVVLTKNS